MKTTDPANNPKSLVGPWDDPAETTPIPRPTSKWVAVAAMQLCDALSQRADTPSEFVRKVRAAREALNFAEAALHEHWPNTEYPHQKCD